MTRLMESMSQEDEIQAAVKQQMGPYYHYFEALKSIPDDAEIQARIPFDMVIE